MPKSTKNYWLLKSEPDVWSWQQQVKKGTERWDGVRNHQAANNLRAMQLGDECFFYHSNIGKEIVGIVAVSRTAYPDPSDVAGRFVCVDVTAVRALAQPVTLAVIKQDIKLQNMALIRQSRLSVMPVAPDEWAHILALAGR